MAPRNLGGRWLADVWREKWNDHFSRRASVEPNAATRRWELDASQLGAYQAALASVGTSADEVDERTWADLEFDKILARLDRSVTPLGAQYLYALLRRYQGHEESLAANVRDCDVFAARPRERDALAEALADLNRNEPGELARFLFGPPESNPSYYRWFYLLSLAALACTAGLLVSRWFLFPMLGCWIVNIVVHLRHGRMIQERSAPLTSLGRLLGCVQRLIVALRGVDLPEVAELQALAGPAKDLHGRVSLGLLRKLEGNDLAVALIEYLNLLCLFELSASCRAVAALNQRRAEALRLFQVVARLDAFQGLSRSLAEFPYVCRPTLNAGRRFEFEAVFHPLV